jgi:hypothetical protein
MSIKEMKQALEALDYAADIVYSKKDDDIIGVARKSLRQAIEQAEKQEKLCKYCGGIGRVVCDGRCMPEQKPMAWISQGGDVSRSKKHFEEMGFNFVIPLYTAPFNWVGIAVDEISSLWGNADADLWLFAQAIEAKLKERNT